VLSAGSVLSDPAYVAGLRAIPTSDPGALRSWPAVDVAGVTPGGDPIEVRIGSHGGDPADDGSPDGDPPDGDPAGGGPRRWLLAFLHTNCDGCQGFWAGFRNPERIGLPAGVSCVVVTKGPEAVAAADVARAARGIDRVPVVMSDRAWSDYRVLGYPFFVLVDVATNTVVGETVGFGWDDVVSMVASTDQTGAAGLAGSSEPAGPEGAASSDGGTGSDGPAEQ
jgi:hypothetical protein